MGIHRLPGNLHFRAPRLGHRLKRLHFRKQRQEGFVPLIAHLFFEFVVFAFLGEPETQRLRPRIVAGGAQPPHLQVLGHPALLKGD